ncbi:receptor-like kinase TMK4 [Papaver somniferum]|uniref:receptor-like kinase TMK4 n=1 Tax=Papaver somniferum TaxID=3469 RepID=UPI000E704069|nr:receptor-like kinase TMK4 [Papaver somniferum]
MAFQAELSILKMTHRHLVSVIGFCNQGVEHLIVYEFMESGTLHQKLFEWIDTGGNPMSWDERIGYEAKISDYGLVKAMTDDEKSVVTKLAGTRGYLAPEYAMTGHLSIKADVYFGIVLLELITGQTIVDDGQAGKNLAMRFRPVYKRGMENVRALVDRSLDPDAQGLNGGSERWPQRAEEEEEEEEEAAFDRERFLRDLGNDGEGTTAYYSVWDLEQGQ